MSEAGFGVGAQRGKRLQRQLVAGTPGLLEGRLENLLGLFGACLDARIGFLGLLDALLGEGTELIGGLARVERRKLGDLGRLGCGLAHGSVLSVAHMRRCLVRGHHIGPSFVHCNNNFCSAA